MNIGFIGLGTMGSGMALNLLKAGHRLTINDMNRDAAASHLEAGAVWAHSAQAVAEASDMVFTSLPGPAEVETVALADSGILSGIRPGKVYFDLSTNSPTVIRRVHDAFSAHGAHVLDAPVSGGPEGARSGRLAIWVGGDRGVFERSKPVLDMIGDQAYYVGSIGTGSVAKLVHNCTGYILQTAIAETFTMGVKAGVEPEALWQAVRQGALGRRRTFDGLQKNYLPGRFDPPDFALRLARKDVSLAAEMGREFDVPMRLANLALAELTEASNRGWEQRDARAAMLLQEERAGVEVRVPQEAIMKILQAESGRGD